MLQVAIVLFRTLVEFYNTPLGLSTLPLIVWRFATIGIGSILTGKHPLADRALGGVDQELHTRKRILQDRAQ